MAITLRPQRLEDAQRFYEIVTNPNFKHLHVPVRTLEDEKEFLRKNEEKRTKNLEHNYTILRDGEVVGACGIKIDQHRPHIGELGYFVAEEHWGRGIATEAVHELERIGFEELGVERMQILMKPDNKASERVAIKAGYEKEGLMRAVISGREGRKEDCWLYAKTKRDYRESHAASSRSKS